MTYLLPYTGPIIYWVKTVCCMQEYIFVLFCFMFELSPLNAYVLLNMHPLSDVLIIYHGGNIYQVKTVCHMQVLLGLLVLV